MGARAAMLVRAPASSSTLEFLFHLIFVIVMLLLIIPSNKRSCFGAPQDAQFLFKFKKSLGNAQALAGWDGKKDLPPCLGHRANWVGVVCFDGDVWGLQLENKGLAGSIDVDALASLPRLRTLSFMNNTFSGSLPNLKPLSKLKSLYLSYNHFSGEIPEDAFAGMDSLKKVYLGNNDFSGKIPSSLASLPKLMVLRLDANKFDGSLPNFNHKTLHKINVSNNDLEGPIPPTLSNMDRSSFSGNQNLCGAPLDPCISTAASATHGNNNKITNSHVKIVLIVILVLLILVIIVAALTIFLFKLKQRQDQSSHLDINVNETQTNNSHDHQSVVLNAVTRSQEREGKATVPGQAPGYLKKGDPAAAGKLVFVRDERAKFDLQDLLRASAEILGSGTFGSSYKAVMMDGQAVVVKRYKQMNNVGREEFFEHMRRMGSLSHPNLLPLVAYYYRREEKLLLSDFVEKGSLASHLHGKRDIDKPGLDWSTRLKIIKGAAKGMAYLYNALPTMVVSHGHLKSSNVLLDESYEPLLTDYALLPVINIEHAQQLMIAYKSPEYANTDRVTKKTDVWSFGVLILEILTGKFPEDYLAQRYNRGGDIAIWVKAMIHENKTGEVFDAEMRGVGNGKGELLKLLKIGLTCCEEDVGRRLDLKDVVEQIQELRSSSDHDHQGTDQAEGDYSSSIIASTNEADHAILHL